MTRSASQGAALGTMIAIALLAGNVYASGAGSVGLILIALQAGACLFVFLLGLGLVLLSPLHRKWFAGLMAAALGLATIGNRWLWLMPLVPAIAALVVYFKTRRKLWLAVAACCLLLCASVLLRPSSAIASQVTVALLVSSPAPALLWLEERKRAAVILELLSLACCWLLPWMVMSRFSEGRWMLGIGAIALCAIPLAVFLWRAGWRRLALALALIVPGLLELFIHL